MLVYKEFYFLSYEYWICRLSSQVNSESDQLKNVVWAIRAVRVRVRWPLLNIAGTAPKLTTFKYGCSVDPTEVYKHMHHSNYHPATKIEVRNIGLYRNELVIPNYTLGSNGWKNSPTHTYLKQGSPQKPKSTFQ